jgi:phage gp16-like protein
VANSQIDSAIARRERLKAIHVLKKQLGLDDETYRAMLRKITGKDSSAVMTSGEHRGVLDEMRRLLDGHASPSARVRSPGDAAGAPCAAQLAKIHALWADLREAGALKDASERALRQFARRVTGRDALEWLAAADANKVIEGLKSWLARTRAPAA